MLPYTIAIAWLRKEDWPHWLAIDPDFPPHHDRWLRRMDELFAQFKERGTAFEKIVIDPDEFLEWSRFNGGEVDFKARARFAAALSKAGKSPKTLKDIHLK